MRNQLENAMSENNPNVWESEVTDDDSEHVVGGQTSPPGTVDASDLPPRL